MRDLRLLFVAMLMIPATSPGAPIAFGYEAEITTSTLPGVTLVTGKFVLESGTPSTLLYDNTEVHFTGAIISVTAELAGGVFELFSPTEMNWLVVRNAPSWVFDDADFWTIRGSGEGLLDGSAVASDIVISQIDQSDAMFDSLDFPLVPPTVPSGSTSDFRLSAGGIFLSGSVVSISRVPEPRSGVLLGLGAILAGLRRFCRFGRVATSHRASAN